MSMDFDYIKCVYPLPRPGFSRKLFQTKSLGRTGSQYLINKKGELMIVIGDKKRKYPFSGVVNFYEFYKHLDGWMEYRAFFDEGVLSTDIEEIEFSEKNEPSML